MLLCGWHEAPGIGLVATVFPEFIARDGLRARARGLSRRQARGVVRPAAEGEDTAPRALTGP